MRAEEGEVRTMTFQVADVTKPLASVGRTTSKGHMVVVDGVESHIMHKAVGRRIRLHKTGSVFVMRMKIMAPEENVNDARAHLARRRGREQAGDACEC